MVQPEHFCGGARELETDLGSLRSNLCTHKYVLNNDTDKVRNAPDHHRSWDYLTDRDMQKMTMIDLTTSSQDLQKKNSPCLHDFHCCVGEIYKMYGDRDGRLNMDRKSYYNMLQRYYNADENVRTYAN